MTKCGYDLREEEDPAVVVLIWFMVVLGIGFLAFVYWVVSVNAGTRKSEWLNYLAKTREAVLRSEEASHAAGYTAQDYVTMENASGLVCSRKKCENVALSEVPTTLGQGPTSGTYFGLYQEGTLSCHGKTNMAFHPEERGTSAGWKITGEGKDADGKFQITEGWVAPTGKAYWVESQEWRQILNTGIFDFAEGTYRGRWYADNGVKCENYCMEHENGRLSSLQHPTQSGAGNGILVR